MSVPRPAPVTDHREMGTHKALEAIAGSVLARLPKNGRAVSLAAVTARLWGAGTSQCRLALLVRACYMGGLPPLPWDRESKSLPLTTPGGALIRSRHPQKNPEF